MKGRYTCSHEGTKVCHEDWKGLDCDTCVYPCEKCIINNKAAIGATVLEVVLTLVAGALLVGLMVLRRRLKEKERHLVTGSKERANAGKVKVVLKEKKALKDKKVEYACADEEPYIEMREYFETPKVEYVYADQFKEDPTYADVTIPENKTAEAIYDDVIVREKKTTKKVVQKNKKQDTYVNVTL